MTDRQIKAACIGAKLSALEAVCLLWTNNSKGRTQAAWAAFANGLESLTATQIQERLAAEGIEITSDAAADLQVDAVRKGPCGVLAIFKANDEHPCAAMDVRNRAGLHGKLPSVAPVIVQEGGAA